MFAGAILCRRREMRGMNNVTGGAGPDFTVTFFQGPTTPESRAYAANVMLGWTLVTLASSLLLRRLHVEIHGAHAAAFVAFIFGPPLLVIPFGLCTCALTSTAFVFRPFGRLGRADTTPLVDLRYARLIWDENPTLELTLKTGLTKRFGPWKPLTSLASLDRRREKLTHLVDVINSATRHR